MKRNMNKPGSLKLETNSMMENSDAHENKIDFKAQANNSIQDESECSSETLEHTIFVDYAHKSSQPTSVSKLPGCQHSPFRRLEEALTFLRNLREARNVTRQATI